MQDRSFERVGGLPAIVGRGGRAQTATVEHEAAAARLMCPGSW
jgi:hypothetical protein